jgi:ankyrin repeat protein
MADFLIGRGADVNAEADYGLTPLTIVCRKRYVGLARVLLDKGAKVDQGSGSDTPLMTLCTYTGDWPGGARAVDWASKTLELTKLLIDHGANVNGTEPAVGSSEYGLGSTPLIEICSIEFSGDGFVPVSYTKEEKVACEAVYSDVIRLLLDNKADINKCDNYGESPLAYACEAGNLWAVKLLLERGADVNKASKDGTTPLGIANKLPDKAIAKLLLEHGAKSNAGK